MIGGVLQCTKHNDYDYIGCIYAVFDREVMFGIDVALGKKADWLNDLSNQRENETVLSRYKDESGHSKKIIF